MKYIHFALDAGMALGFTAFIIGNIIELMTF
jgi:hypothetical protein